MKNNSIKNGIKKTVLGLAALTLIGCNGYSTLIKKQEVASIPEDQYERIIKLYNPEGMPDKTLAGLVFIKKGASVCTNYSREVIIKSLNELELMEKHAYPFFSTYAIKVGEETFGFIAVDVDYRVYIWENKKNTECQYKVDIVLPENTQGSTGGVKGSLGGPQL